MTDNPRPFASEPQPAASTAPGERRRTELGDHSLRFWMIVLGLGCISLLAMMWGISSTLATKGSERLLRIGLLLPKLKSNHGDRKADAFRMSEPEPSESAHPKERKTPAPPPPPDGAREIAAVIDHPKVTIVEAPLPHAQKGETPEPPPFASIEPGLQLSPRVELTPVPQPLSPGEGRGSECPDPVVYLQPCTPHRGDSPMMRNWKTLAMYSLLTTAGVVFAPQPILAGGDKNDELKKAIEQLAKQVELNNLGIADLKKSMEKDIDSMRSQLLHQKLLLDSYKVQLDDLNKKVLAGGAPAVDKAFMDELRGSIKTLNESLARLRPNTVNMPMFRANGASSTLGRVVIVNMYAEDLLFIINDTPHRVPALRTMMLDNIPIGTLRYEVVANRWGLVDRQTVNINAGDTFTLTASHPR